MKHFILISITRIKYSHVATPPPPTQLAHNFFAILFQWSLYLCCRHTQVWSPAKNLPFAHTKALPLCFHIRSLPFHSLQEQQFSSQEAFLTHPGKGCTQEVPNQNLLKMIWPFPDPCLSYSLKGCTAPPVKESQINQGYCQFTPPTLPLSPHGCFWHTEVRWSPWGAPALAVLILYYQSQSRCWYRRRGIVPGNEQGLHFSLNIAKTELWSRKNPIYCCAGWIKALLITAEVWTFIKLLYSCL